MKLKLTTLLLAPMLFTSCLEEKEPANASGSVSKKTVAVATDNDGWTIEQKNIAERLKRDNNVGSVKHLYVISPFSGQVILYSTVKGKVTSSGKRLTPNTVAQNLSRAVGVQGIDIQLNGRYYTTSEVLQDDGTYGSSCEYIYWFDASNKYHQHFFTGGQIIHIADQPIAVKNITLNLEQQ